MRRAASPARRLRITLFVVAFITSVFAGRLFQLQGVEASAYALQAVKSRSDTVTLYAERGDILDRNGAQLATTVQTVAVSADPKVTAEKAAETADILAPLLGVAVLDLEKKLSRPDSAFVYLARNVDTEVWEQASRQLAEAKLPGVWADPDPLRVYPAGEVAGNVLGFVGTDGDGLAGLEYTLNERLRGENGWAQYERANGRRIPLGKTDSLAPVPGVDVGLTLDRDVQWAAEQAIAKQVEKSKAESGSVVVLDSHTGDLLALATAPGVDPNRPTRTPSADRGNRPVQEVYEPGSVAKAFTAAALLDAGVVTPETEITVPGSLIRSTEQIGDWWSHDVLRLTFAGAIARSSNIGTVLAAEQMEPRVQAEYLRGFGLGAPSGLDFPGESKGLLKPASEWSELDRASVSFGQSVGVTAVQMAAGLGVIANGGLRVPPRLVDATFDENGERKARPRAEPTRVISESAAEQVGAIMEQVTGPEGLAPAAGIDGYRVAGKTGTAQRVAPECGCYRGYSASFGGFAPADTGRFVVYAVVHDPQGETSGSGVAAPVFSEVMRFVLQRYAVPPTGEPSPTLEMTW